MLVRKQNLAVAAASCTVWPRVPVARPCMPTADAILPYLERIDAARWYSNFGPLLTEFEARLSERFAGAPLATAVNGTQALTLTLQALDIAPGKRCLMAAWTFVATAHAAMAAGLEPWFVDVNPDDMTLDLEAVDALVRRAPGAVGAVIVTAPFGLMQDMVGWRAWSDRTGVPVIIDAAAAFDVADDAHLPTMISLHATKALGVGEGGFVASTDPALVERIRQLSAFGFNGTREALRPATNAKLSEYSAAVGHAALDVWPVTRRRYARAAQWLRMSLSHTPEVVFQPGWGDRWVSSTCVVHLPQGSTDRIEARLADAGIDSRRWWSSGCHASPAFAQCPRGDLTATERLAGSTLGLPYWADMELDEIERIAQALSEAIAEG